MFITTRFSNRLSVLHRRNVIECVLYVTGNSMTERVHGASYYRVGRMDDALLFSRSHTDGIAAREMTILSIDLYTHQGRAQKIQVKRERGSFDFSN